MEFDSTSTWLPDAALPDGYEWLGWSAALLERHARAKFESFRSEVDSAVFPSLGDRSGCLDLMSEIAQRSTFVPEATWLVACRFPDGSTDDCATIQGVVQTGLWGAIQNVGVVPEHRGHGLGRALVLRCLQGFRQAGIPRVYLEVTACNAPAVRLYRSIGFRLARTTYKAVEQPALACSVV